jgi:hypothetical protein
MKKATIILSAVLFTLSGAALAGCPDVIGIFSTIDGTIDPGRASEGWCGAGGAPVGPGVPGNTINGASWNGTILGAQWTIADMSVNATGAVLVSDTVNADGNGQRTYETGYDGGQFWLSGSGPWTTGDVALSGAVQDFLVLTTVTFMGGNPVGQTSNITFTGTFFDCPDFAGCVVDFAIANAVLVWNSNMGGNPPPDYPAFLCDASAGEVFQSNDVMLSIDCAVRSEQASWTYLKGLYR